MTEVCPACDGDGQICDVCGDTWIACECDDFGDTDLEPGFHECPACDGTGLADGAKGEGQDAQTERQ